MKILAFLAIVVAGITFAQPQSFRSMSTGGMILDDLDLWFSGMLFTQPVPDRLLDLDGIRVYTGLSNLSTGTDMIFEETDSTRGGFLLGGSWSPNGKPYGLGILTEFMDDRILEDLFLNGPGGSILVSGQGEVEGTWSEYTDSDGDGTLDTRHTVYQKASGRSDSTSLSAGVYGAWAPNESLKLGLGVSMIQMTSEINSGDMNYSTTVSDSNLVSGVETYFMDNDVSGTDKDTINGLRISASGRGTMTDKLDIGGMFQFSSLSSDMSQEIGQTGIEDFLPGESGVYDYSVWSLSEEFTVSTSGNRFGGGLDMMFQIDEDWELEFAGTYYTMSLNGTSGDYSSNSDSTYIVTIGSLIDTTDVSMTGSGNVSRDISDNVFTGGLKISATPAKALTISMGTMFSMYDNVNTVQYSSSNTEVETHSDGDDEFADPDDYVSTSTWSQTEETRTTNSTTRISIPVGLEFGVLPKVSVRLGASPGFVWENEVETTNLISASPMTTHTVYGDGTELLVVEDPWNTTDGTRIESDDSYTEIPFSYGVGYSPSDFVQIDLMGLGSSFDQWRLSATLSF
ncbi:MAG: hypothetical protein KAW14_00395 [Candidatus Aegiribacteria sp.]|nr:hypothetical protein [Candidatus Aegiribacteria sp.]